ncbi:MAG: hypothetical protein ACETWE_06020, partial [Candidatus Bathyarchaeia archaeon]
MPIDFAIDSARSDNALSNPGIHQCALVIDVSAKGGKQTLDKWEPHGRVRENHRIEIVTGEACVLGR